MRRNRRACEARDAGIGRSFPDFRFLASAARPRRRSANDHDCRASGWREHGAAWAPWSRLHDARTGGRGARLGPCCGLQTAFAGRRCSCGTPCGFGSSPGGPRRRGRSMNMTAASVASPHSPAPEEARSTAHGPHRPAGPAPAGSPSRRTQPHAAPAWEKAQCAVTWLWGERRGEGIGQASRRVNIHRTVGG